MEKKIGNLFKGDKVVWMVFFFLCMISIVEVFSASSNLTYKSQNYMGPIIYHMAMILVGVVVAVFTLNIPCRYFKLLTPFLLIVTFVTLFWVLIGGESINGANRVISIFHFTFQPSEIAKGTMVLVTAQILSATQRENGADRNAFRYILVVLLPIAFLIGIENLSTAALLCAVIFLMMFIGRIPMSQLGRLMGAAAIAVALFLTAVMTLGSIDGDRTEENHMTEVVNAAGEEEVDKDAIKGGGMFHRFATWRNRIMKHLEGKEVPPEEFDLDKDMQVAHANIAIVSSNIIGKGPGNSVERDYLPQAFSDFIYAIIIEELGLLGGFVVMFLYIILLFRAAQIASRSDSMMLGFMVLGLALLIVTQALINMAVAAGVMPVTGQPLPLVSRGGSSIMVNCFYIGLMLNISRTATKTDPNYALEPIKA